MSGTAKSKGFLVNLEVVGVQSWCERIERPVTNKKIVEAVKRKKVLPDARIRAESHSDYGGTVFASNLPVGSYFIVPGSEK